MDRYKLQRNTNSRIYMSFFKSCHSVIQLAEFIWMDSISKASNTSLGHQTNQPSQAIVCYLQWLEAGQETTLQCKLQGSATPVAQSPRSFAVLVHGRFHFGLLLTLHFTALDWNFSLFSTTKRLWNDKYRVPDQKTGNGLEAIKMVEVSHRSFTGINHFLLTKYRDHNWA